MIANLDMDARLQQCWNFVLSSMAPHVFVVYFQHTFITSRSLFPDYVVSTIVPISVSPHAWQPYFLSLGWQVCGTAIWSADEAQHPVFPTEARRITCKCDNLEAYW